MTTKKSEIKQDPNNTRKHSDLNKGQISQSLKDLGAGRSVVIDNEGFLIAGNGVHEQAKELGIKTKIVETDGSELIVVKRTDLSYKDETRRRLAIADNATGETSEWNVEELTEQEIEEWSIEAQEEEEDIDFENIKSNEERSVNENIKEVTCPECYHKFKT